MELMQNAACALLGCDVPLVLAGMGGVSRAELVAAVSRAGGFGFLGMVREPPELISAEIRRLRDNGCAHFGVNIIPAATEPALLQRQIDSCIEHAVPVVGLFWNVERQVVEQFHKAGILVVHQIGTVEEALHAEAAGAGIVIAQGIEAGGHVRGTQRLVQLLPGVAAALDIPVLAAGGMATGADLVTATALGASGIVLGTALMAAQESFAHDYHKQRLLTAHAEDTVLTANFHINWPREAKVRVLDSAITRGELGDPHADKRTIIGDEEGRPIFRFSTDSPLRTMTGSFDEMALYAGTGVGQIRKIEPAATIIQQIVSAAARMLEVKPVSVTGSHSSPACYAGEVSGPYAGHLDAGATNAEISALEQLLHAGLCISLAQAEQNGATGKPAFSAKRLVFARWLRVLRHLSGHETSDLHLQSGQSELAHLRALIVHRLGAMIPRLPESRLRAALIQMRIEMQEEMRALIERGAV